MFDHLEPNDSPIESLPILNAYLHTVAATLKPKVDRKAKAVVTIACLPSFEVEWMLALECSRSGHYTSYACTADREIWPLEEAKTITPIKHESPVSAELGFMLHEIYRLALLGTRHSYSPNIGLDGVTYHFAYDHMSGKTWSPPENSLPGKLCALSNDLYNDTVAGRINERRVCRIIRWFRGNLPGLNDVRGGRTKR
ncbi:MAG: hypothetical protein JXM70_12885 [Pirellulales bacterium]|nr:hypothetical protein [Pirellulales bacterium]